MDQAFFERQEEFTCCPQGPTMGVYNPCYGQRIMRGLENDTFAGPLRREIPAPEAAKARSCGQLRWLSFRCSS